MAPQPLRFRAPYPADKSATTVKLPRTPKSPPGTYTGSPVSPLPTTNRTKSRLFLKILLAILGLLAISCLGIFNYRHKFLPETRTRSSVYWKAKSAVHAGLGEKRIFGPQAGEVQAVFADQHAFQVQGPRADRAWLNIFPKSDGRVLVNDPRKYGLPTSAAAFDGEGKAITNTEVYEVAVIKQLECLSFLRQVLIDYDHETHPHVHERAHAYHCLDHIRQALQCAADTTLEPTRNGGVSKSPDQSQHHVGGDQVALLEGEEAKSGYEPAKHTCKNWSIVKGWIEENSV